MGARFQCPCACIILLSKTLSNLLDWSSWKFDRYAEWSVPHFLLWQPFILKMQLLKVYPIFFFKHEKVLQQILLLEDSIIWYILSWWLIKKIICLWFGSISMDYRHGICRKGGSISMDYSLVRIILKLLLLKYSQWYSWL